MGDERGIADTKPTWLDGYERLTPDTSSGWCWATAPDGRRVIVGAVWPVGADAGSEQAAAT